MTVVQFVPRGTRYERIDPASQSAEWVLNGVQHPRWGAPLREEIVRADDGCIRYIGLYFNDDNHAVVARGRLNGSGAVWIGVEAPAKEEEEDDTFNFPVEVKARASARRAAFEGKTQREARARIRKQWPGMASHEAQDIVERAFNWHDYRRPGRRITIDGIERRVTSLASLNKRFARLEASDNPASIILRDEARPIPRKEFDFRLTGCGNRPLCAAVISAGRCG